MKVLLFLLLTVVITPTLKCCQSDSLCIELYLRIDLSLDSLIESSFCSDKETEFEAMISINDSVVKVFNITESPFTIFGIYLDTDRTYLIQIRRKEDTMLFGIDQFSTTGIVVDTRVIRDIRLFLSSPYQDFQIPTITYFNKQSVSLTDENKSHLMMLFDYMKYYCYLKMDVNFKDSSKNNEFLNRQRYDEIVAFAAENGIKNERFEYRASFEKTSKTKVDFLILSIVN